MIGPSGLYNHVNYENYYVKFSEKNMKRKKNHGDVDVQNVPK